MSRIYRFVRERPELLALALASLIFVLGALNLAARRRESERPLFPSSSAEDSERVLVGPAEGEPLPPYIERKKVLLADRGASGPRSASLAVVSFDGYRRGPEVEEFVGAHRLEAVSLQIRVPVPEEASFEVRVEGAIAATVSREIDRLAAEFEEERVAFESLAATTDDPEYRAVYREDAGQRANLVALLRSDPGVVYAVVVKASVESLVRASEEPGVRLVDLPDDPSATTSTHRFAGILPEEA